MCLSWKYHLVTIAVSETTGNLLGIALRMLHFQANLPFPYVSTPPGRLPGKLLRSNLIYLIYLFVSRHEVHSMNTHTLQNAG